MELQLSLPVEIRPLRAGDLDELEWDSEQTIDAEYICSVVAERGDEICFLLALLNGRPIGRLGIDYGRKADEGIAHLWAFSVLPVLQRLGIGTALVREAESLIALSPRAVTFVEVGVDDGNDEAARLYRRLGYRDAGSERGSNGELIQLLRRPISAVMRKEGARTRRSARSHD